MWKSLPLRGAVIFGAVAAIVDFCYECWAIGNSTSSTAAIGYVFAPVVAIIIALPWAAVGFFAGYVAKAFRSKLTRDIWIAALGTTASLAFVAYSAVQLARDLDLAETIDAIDRMDAGQLDEFVSNSSYRDNKFALGAVCLNPCTSADTLAKIAARKDPALHEAMGANPRIMGENRRGLAVMRLVSRHPNVTSDILAVLSHSSDSYVVGDVVGNDKTPESVLRESFARMRNSPDAYLVEWGLAHNRNTPADLLESLANSRDQYTLRGLVNNDSTPAATRDRVEQRLARGDYGPVPVGTR